VEAPEGGPPAKSAGDLRGDVLSALLNLGYHRPLAERAVERAQRSGGSDFEQALRQALRELAR
jgi:Holliday junction resolvasome RuvABC DNA-binding subunit